MKIINFIFPVTQVNININIICSTRDILLLAIFSDAVTLPDSVVKLKGLVRLKTISQILFKWVIPTFS